MFAGMMMVVNRSSFAISTVLRPTSFINGIAREAKTSSASMIIQNNVIAINFRNICISLNSHEIENLREIRYIYLEETDSDLRFELVERDLHLLVAGDDSSEF